MAAFFIDRPVFAWVIAILIVLGGALATLELAVEAYPEIAPPAVTVSARTIPGASADVIESSVTSVIEQQLTGLERAAVLQFHQQFRGLRQHQPLLRERHRHRHRRGRGAEPHQSRRAAPAAGSARPGHHCGEGQRRLPHGGRAAVRDRSARQSSTTSWPRSILDSDPAHSGRRRRACSSAPSSPCASG